jgi:hypothetical protein
MIANGVDGVAEDKCGIDLSVVERFYAEVIASAKERESLGVPNGEREVASEMCDTALAP